MWILMRRCAIRVFQFFASCCYKMSEYFPECKPVEPKNCFANEDYCCCRCARISFRFAGRRAQDLSSQIEDLYRC